MADVVVTFSGEADDLLAALRSIGRESDGAGEKISKTTTKAERLSAELTTMATGAAAGVAAVAALGAAVFQLSQRAADAVNDISDMSARTGIASRTLRGLEVAARGSGTSLKELESAISRATRSGVDFDEAVKSIQAIEDPTLRAHEAMQLLGRDGGRLIQVLGSSNIRSFEQFAEDFGRDTGPEAAAAAAEWQRQVSELETVLDGFTDASGILPTMNALVRDLTTGVVFLSGAFSTLRDAVSAGAFVSMEEVFQRATDRAREYHDAVEAMRASVDAGGESWEEFRARQELGLLDAPVIEFKQTVDDVEKATSDAAKAAAEWSKGMAGIQFGQTSEQIKQVVEVVDPLTGSVREVEATFSSLVPTLGATFEPMGTFTGLVTGSSAEVDKLAEALKKAQKRAEMLEKMSSALRGVQKAAATAGAGISAIGDIYTAVAERATEGSAKQERLLRTAFALQKAAAAGDVVVKTAQGIAAALPLGPVAGPIYAAFAAATGAAQLAAVLATPFGGGGSISQPSTSLGDGGASGGAGQSMVKPSSGYSVYQNPNRGAGYRHRDLDVVASDGEEYPDGAFTRETSSGAQRRYRRG